jgi:hypothetical protein
MLATSTMRVRVSCFVACGVAFSIGAQAFSLAEVQFTRPELIDSYMADDRETTSNEDLPFLAHVENEHWVMLYMLGTGRSRNRLAHSFDGGVRWLAPFAEPIMSDGNEEFRLHHVHFSKAGTGILLASTESEPRRYQVHVFRSIDGGLTWQERPIPDVPHYAPLSGDDSGIRKGPVVLSDGETWMARWFNGSGKYMAYGIYSKDDGVTWDVSFAVPGQGPDLYTDGNGVWIVSTYDASIKAEKQWRSCNEEDRWEPYSFGFPELDGYVGWLRYAGPIGKGVLLAVLEYVGEPEYGEEFAWPASLISVTSSDGGDTWSELEVLTEEHTYPADGALGVEFDLSGKAVALLSCDERLETYQYVSGQGWRLASDFGQVVEVGRCSFVFDGGRTILFAASRMMGPSIHYGRDDILLLRSTDLGQTYTGPYAPFYESLRDQPEDDLSPVLATDKNGTWVAAWASNRVIEDEDGADHDVFLSSSQDYGNTWSDPRKITNEPNDPYPDRPKALEIRRNGVWIVVTEKIHSPSQYIWDWDATRSLVLYRSENSGIAWSAGIELDGSYGWGNAGIVTDGHGNWITYERDVYRVGNELSESSAYCSHDNGATWSEGFPLGLWGSVRIEAVGEGQFVAFGHAASVGDTYRSEPNTLIVCRSNDQGTTWSEPAAPFPSELFSSHLDEFTTMTEANGNLLLAWETSFLTQSGANRAKVYVTVSEDGGFSWNAPVEIKDTVSDLEAEKVFHRVVPRSFYPSPGGRIELLLSAGVIEYYDYGPKEDWYVNYTTPRAVSSNDRGKTWSMPSMVFDDVLLPTPDFVGRADVIKNKILPVTDGMGAFVVLQGGNDVVVQTSVPCEDVDNSGAADAVDVQTVINAALGLNELSSCDVNRDGKVNALDVQAVINAALGMA